MAKAVSARSQVTTCDAPLRVNNRQLIIGTPISAGTNDYILMKDDQQLILCIREIDQSCRPVEKEPVSITYGSSQAHLRLYRETHRLYTFYTIWV